MVKRVLLSPPGRNYYPMDDIFIYSSRQVVNSLCEPSLITSGWQLLQEPHNNMGAGNESTGTDDLNLVLFSMLLLPLLSSFFFVQIDSLMLSPGYIILVKIACHFLVLISLDLEQKENVLSFQLLKTPPFAVLLCLIPPISRSLSLSRLPYVFLTSGSLGSTLSYGFNSAIQARTSSLRGPSSSTYFSKYNKALVRSRYTSLKIMPRFR